MSEEKATMTSERWRAYKRDRKVAPSCVVCKTPILVSNEPILVMKSSSNTKYACPECTRRSDERGMLVYQYPSSQPANKIEKTKITPQLTDEQRIAILNHTCMRAYLKGKLTFPNEAKKCKGQLCTDCPLPWRYVVQSGEIDELKLKNKKLEEKESGLSKAINYPPCD